MEPYIIIFLIPSLFHFFYNKIDYQQKFFLLLSICIIVFLFCVLRGYVGGDHRRYLFLFDTNQFSLDYLIYLKKDFLFNYSLWFVKIIFTKFIYFQILMGLFFFIPLFIFLYKTNTFFLGLIVSIPIGIYLVHIGYIKQSISVSFTLLIILSLQREKVFDSLFFFVAAIFFHASSIILILPIFLSFLIKKFSNKFHQYNIKILISLFYFVILIVFLLLILVVKNKIFNLDNFFFLPENLKNSIEFFLVENRQYGEEIKSLGIYYRSVPLLASIIISIILLYRNKLLLHFNIHYFFIFLFLLSFILLIFGYSMIADRLLFYSLPFQILMLNSGNHLFQTNKNKIFFDILVILLFLFILLIWLTYSTFSIHLWQPYHFNQMLF